MKEKSLNVYGKPLQICGNEPITGAFRDGCCNTGPGDIGTHFGLPSLSFPSQSIKNVENNLYQDKIETSQDEINYPRKWTNHITHLYDRLTTDDQAPNDGMLDRFQELKSDYERYINPYQEIVSVDVPNFTKFLREKGAMGIILDQ